MIKIKKVFAVLTVVCFLLNFTVILASAASAPDYTFADPINASELKQDLSTVLFPAVNLYPGESIGSRIEIRNTTGAVQTVTMEVIKGASANNLADAIDLVIKKEGTDEEIYNGKLADVDFKTNNIVFYNAETAVYSFNAVFNNVTRRYMGAVADFQVIFTVTTVTISPDPNPLPDNWPSAGDPPILVDGSLPTAPAGTVSPVTTSPVTQGAAETSASAGNTSDETPQGQPDSDDYYNFEQGDIPLGSAELDNNSDDAASQDGGGLGLDAGAGAISQDDDVAGAAYETEEIFENFEPDFIPLADLQFIDKMPKTGEKMNPFAYQMTGLGFVLAGGLTIVGAGRKLKENK